MNLGKRNDWIWTYRGYVYANKPLSIHHRINNKVIIDQLHKQEIERLYNALTS